MRHHCPPALFTLAAMLSLSVLASCEKRKRSPIKERFRDYVFAAADISVETDILYRDSLTDYASGDSISRNLRYDLYGAVPTLDTMQSRPLIVWMHPGSGYTGDKANERATCVNFARYGYAVAAINYRLNRWLPLKPNLTQKEVVETLYREVQDARFLIRSVRHRAAANTGFRIDTNRIFLAGFSQGGVIALNTTYLDDGEIGGTVDQIALGQLNYGGASFGGARALPTAAVSFAGALLNLNTLQGPEIPPAIFIHSTGDNLVPIDCGLEGQYKLVSVCGGRAVANRLNQMGVPNDFRQYNDVFNATPPAPFSHGNLTEDPRNLNDNRINPTAMAFTMESLYFRFFE